ncbi:MAG: TonB-dependent receptor [Gammaproteobacteria bacterium]
MNPRLLTMCIAAVAQIVPLSQVATAAELDEMITRAERRERNLQEVPVAVTTFDAADIDRRQITGSLDLIQNVPNLTGSHNVSLGGSNSFFLRGIGNAESIATFDVPIGTYIDEIYISRQNQNQVRMYDVERLEVLRGPQGTLFGRNTTGGAITVALQKPSDETEAVVEGSIGNYERYWLRGKFGGAITDQLFGQINAFVIDEDGWMDSVTTGETYNGEEAAGARAAVRWVPSDAVSWDLSVQYSDTTLQAIGVAASPPGSQTYATGDTTKNLTALGDCRGDDAAASGSVVPVCSFNEMKSTLLASNIEWDTGPVTINFITGWYDLDHNFAADFLDNDAGFFGIDTFIIANEGSHEQFSQEIKFTGDAADGRFNYVGGLFYMDEDNTTNFSDWVGNKPALAPSSVRTPLSNSTESIAIYGQGDWAVTDKLTLLAGGRWTDEEKDFSINGTFTAFTPAPTPVPVNPAAITAAGIPLEQSVDKFTYKLGGDYAFTDDVMAYLTYTTGFKSGGWNARGTAVNQLQAFGPEEVKSIEAGIRSEFIDNRVRTNLTLFWTEYEDIQIATVFPGTTAFITNNAGDTEVKGAELEVQVQATNNIRIFGNIGLMDAEYTRLSAGAVAASIGPDPVRTPDSNAMIGAEWTLPRGFFAGGQVSWTDDYFMGNSNQPETLIEAFTLVNAQVGWRSDNERWEVVGECKNCFDEEWFGTNLFNVLYTADPVRYNLRVKFSL